MEPNVFLGYPARGIVCVLNDFGHKQYPSTCQKICYEVKCIIRYFERGIACSLNLFGHEQYPCNSLDQNNSAYGFYNVAYLR